MKGNNGQIRTHAKGVPAHLLKHPKKKPINTV